MKYTIIVDGVSAQTDSMAVAIKLLTVLSDSPTPAVKPAVAGNGQHGETQVRKHRHHNHRKQCPECGKMCKGLIGLGIHRQQAHGVRSKSYEQNQDLHQRDLDVRPSVKMGRPYQWHRCTDCGNSFLGVRGLGIHKQAVHGINHPQHDANKARREELARQEAHQDAAHAAHEALKDFRVETLDNEIL